MQSFIYYAAIVINIIAALAVFFFAATQARGNEYFLMLLFVLPSAFALAALFDLAGPTERKLARDLRLTKMQKELETLKSE